MEIGGSKGFVRVNSLSKWGDQEVLVGIRKYPDGIPKIKRWIYKTDNSWKNELEYIFNNIYNKRNNFYLINKEAYDTLKISNNLSKTK